jgi:hypothetical protein
MSPENLKSSESNRTLEWLGNQVRIAYAEYLDKKGELPKILKDELNDFYSSLNEYNSGKEPILPNHLAEMQNKAQILLKTLQAHKGQDSDYAFKA